MTDREYVLAVFPNAVPIVAHLGHDTKSVRIVTTHGSARGWEMDDVESKAWSDARKEFEESLIQFNQKFR